MPITYPTRHTKFINHAKHTLYSIIYISLIIQSYSTKTDRLGINRQPNTARSRPAPRSGWGVSLRRVPPPPRRGHKNTSLDNAGSRLGETPLAWASCLLAQKSSWPPGRPFAQQLWASSLFISPRRVWLAWARLTGLATVSPAAAKFFTQTVHTIYSHASKRNITPSN